MFGFTPQAFSETVYNILAKEISIGLKEIESIIKNEPEIHGGLSTCDMEQMFTKLVKVSDYSLQQNTDRLERYLAENVFRIPDNVVLPEDEIQENYSDPKQKEADLDEKIKETENKIKASLYTSQLLKNELLIDDQLHKQAQQRIEDMKNGAEDVHSFEDATSLIISGKELIEAVKRASENE